MLSQDVYESITMFYQAFYSCEKALRKILRPAKLTVSQVIVLATLVPKGPPMTLTKIARFLPIETASVSLAIDRLEERKLIRRRHSKTDRRTIDITLTPQGEEVIESIAPAIRALVRDTFEEKLSSRERQSLIRLTRKIRDANRNRLGTS